MLTTYRAHNVFYLRISPTSVLQLTLHLDARHTMWMTDEILERILSALRTRISPKLRKESREAEKKAKVDVYRGAGYQMAYFFRKTSQKHAVLLKDRRVTYPLGQPMQNGNAQFGLDDDLEAVKPEPSEEEASAAARLSADGPIAIEDDEDVKPEDLKPRLDVRYTGFNIFGRTLVVIVEPWPALPEDMLTPAPAVGQELRQLTATPAPRSSVRRGRSDSLATPAPAPTAHGLFRSETPMSQAPEDDIDAFRMRSQSVFAGLEDDDELPDVDAVTSTGRQGSTISRLGGDREIGASTDQPGIEQFAIRRAASRLDEE